MSTTSSRVASPPLTIRSAGLSDAGRRRPVNEDQFLIAVLTKTMTVTQSTLPAPALKTGDVHGHLFLVADGMGGHRAGEQASALAVELIEQFTLNEFKWFLEDDDVRGAGSAAAEFETAIQEADAAIVRQAAARPDLKGMGTTLTLAYVVGRQLYIVHVGDSRAYLHRDDRLIQITQDHTVVADMVRRGELRPEEAASHHLRHVITNVLGGGESGVRAEAHVVDLQPEDGLLLCSDGLTEVVSAEDIANAMNRRQSPEDTARTLVDLANDRGGPDNITTIVALFGGRSSLAIPS